MKHACRRCSVERVNILCDLYAKGYSEDVPKARKILESLVKLAQDRGYGEGANILAPNIKIDQVRKTCWNISSLLTEEDFTINGVNIHG